MNFVKTSRARSKIRHHLAESERVTAIELGKKLFEKEAERFRLNPRKILSNGDLDRIAAIADRHGSWIVSDEIYRGAERDGRETPTA